MLAELGGLARELRRGAGRVVLLRGEAGIGKTAVITRFTARLDVTVKVLAGGCDPLSAPRPLGPVLDALAGLGPAARGLSTPIDAGDTAGLYRRLLAVLRDGHRWVWVIEDAHWADGPAWIWCVFWPGASRSCRCLIGLTVLAEQRRNGRRYLVGTGGQHRRRRPCGGRISLADRRADTGQVRGRRRDHLRLRNHKRHLAPPTNSRP